MVKADDFGNSSIQYEWPSEPASYNEIGEDCLTLNVWTKDLETKDKPVMVYFHGGGFAWGGTSDPLYDGQYFVQQNEDIVMITCNYRVGFMGFIDFSIPERRRSPDLFSGGNRRLGSDGSSHGRDRRKEYGRSHGHTGGRADQVLHGALR